MTMNFLPHEWVVDFKTSDLDDETAHRPAASASSRSTRPPKLLEEKLRVPLIADALKRPRLDDLLDRSVGQFAATLLCGRAGSGKTVLAATYARKYGHAFWYSIEPADRGWDIFARYFAAALLGIDGVRTRPYGYGTSATRAQITDFLTETLRTAGATNSSPLLLVLDNIHHLYDADWFADFFNQLICSLQPGIHVLMSTRSKPPAPLWRFRSKQMLNVIDEDVLEFTVSESERLLKRRGLPKTLAAKFHTDSCGRISKLIESLDGYAESAADGH